MSRAPAFQFYPKDFTEDPMVKLLSRAQIGSYLLLMCTAWAQEEPGILPSDDDMLAGWAKCTPKEWVRDRVAILRCFKVLPDGRLIQKRLYEERQKQLARSQERQEAGRHGARARWGDSSAIAQLPARGGSAMQEPMANDASSSSSSSASEKDLPPPRARNGAGEPPPTPTPEPHLGPLGKAWGDAQLPGLLSGEQARSLARDLAMLQLEPLAACKAWARIFGRWHADGIMVPPTAVKMREHLALVHQVVMGKLDPDAAPAPKGEKRRDEKPRARQPDSSEVLAKLAEGKS